ncbi:hypothetical protein GPECTOR_635g741 [Gonium pectorale]|uniref:Uncharacterized protein n=1 Tax=Gonium pectorale TaxID=33097 RepID=A0A150FVJ8_GONPE|nr:hypothetical protein GPECTOR_635g741 [Gonium pectorale]|eukprot:KXZ41225.1 hypothetical protein GPECTOR_635g741 [Gonium pectorale]
MRADLLNQRAQQLAEAALQSRELPGACQLSERPVDTDMMLHRRPHLTGAPDLPPDRQPERGAVAPSIVKRRLLPETPRLEISSCFLRSLAAIFPNLTHLALLGDCWRPMAQRLAVAPHDWLLSELQPVTAYQTELDRMDVLAELLRHVPSLTHLELGASLLPCRWSTDKHRQHHHHLERLQELTLHLDTPSLAAAGPASAAAVTGAAAAAGVPSASGRAAIAAAAADRVHSLYSQLPGLRALTLVGGCHPSLPQLLARLPPHLQRCTLRNCRLSLSPPAVGTVAGGGDAAAASAPPVSRRFSETAVPDGRHATAAAGAAAVGAAAPLPQVHQRWVARRNPRGAIYWELVQEPGPAPGLAPGPSAASAAAVTGGGGDQVTLAASAAAAVAGGRRCGSFSGGQLVHVAVAAAVAAGAAAASAPADDDVAVAEVVLEPAVRRLVVDADLTDRQLRLLLQQVAGGRAGELSACSAGAAASFFHGGTASSDGGGGGVPTCSQRAGSVAAGAATAADGAAPCAAWSVVLSRLRLESAGAAGAGAAAGAGPRPGCQRSPPGVEAEAQEARWRRLRDALEAHNVQVTELSAPLSAASRRMGSVLRKLAAAPSRLELRIPAPAAPIATAAGGEPTVVTTAALSAAAAKSTGDADSFTAAAADAVAPSTCAGAAADASAALGEWQRRTASGLGHAAIALSRVPESRLPAALRVKALGEGGERGSGGVGGPAEALAVQLAVRALARWPHLLSRLLASPAPSGGDSP